MPPKANDPTQRQLRVGEEVRHALAEIFIRNETFIPGLETSSITVSEVRISPDLKHATAYVMPLGGLNSDGLIEVLNDNAGTMRREVTRKVVLKFSPTIHFKRDDTFDEAQKITNLLNDPNVKRDLIHDAADALERERDA